MMLNLVCNDCGHVQSVQSITFCVKKVAAESTTNLQGNQFADLYLRSSDPGLRDISIITHKWIKSLLWLYDPNAGQGHCPRYGDAVKDQIIQQSLSIKRILSDDFLIYPGSIQYLQLHA